MITKKVVSAGFVVYRKTSKGIKFLLLYRGRGIWDMPRGRMEATERSLQTAFREVFEETGLKNNELRLQNNFKVFEKFPYSMGKEQIFKIVIFYLAETDKVQITISDEHEGYGWFTLGEAKKHLAKFKTRASILKKAWDLVKSKESPAASSRVVENKPQVSDNKKPL